MLRILSTVRYSEETEEREKEECAFLMFLDYIEETHKGFYICMGGLLWLPVVFWLALGPTLYVCLLMFYSTECILA